MFVPLAQALAVAEYLLANATERAAEEIIDNSSQIAVCAAVARFSVHFLVYILLFTSP